MTCIWHPVLQTCADVPERTVAIHAESGWLRADELDLVETTPRHATTRTFVLAEHAIEITSIGDADPTFIDGTPPPDTPAEEADPPTTSEED